MAEKSGKGWQEKIARLADKNPLAKKLYQNFLEKFGKKEKEPQNIAINPGEQQKLGDLLKWEKSKKGEIRSNVEAEATLQLGSLEESLPLKIFGEEITRSQPIISGEKRKEQFKYYIDLTLPASLKEKYNIRIGGPWAGDTYLRSGSRENILSSEDILKIAGDRGLIPENYAWDPEERRFIQKTEETSLEEEDSRLRVSNWAQVSNLELTTIDRNIRAVGDDTSLSYLWLELYPKDKETNGGKILTVSIWANEGIVRCESVDQDDLDEFRLRNSLTKALFTGQRVNPGE